MALKDQILVGGVWVDSAVRFANTTGVMLASATESGTGELQADTYTLTASAVAGGTATITVQTLSPNNIYGHAIGGGPRQIAGVALNGATIYRNIIPGMALVFAATTANGNVSTVIVGLYGGTFDAFGGTAGVPTAGVRHRVYNDGTGAVSNAKAGLRTHSILYKKIGNVFDHIRPFADGATEKVTGGGSQRTQPYNCSIANVAGAGAAKTADLLVAGVAFGANDISDYTLGTTRNNVGLKAIDPPYLYEVVAGVLTGLVFALDDVCANGDTANILIFLARNVQIAPDNNGGSEPVAGWGTIDVVLTQAGQSAGVIQPAGEAFYWVRLVVPAGASHEKNPAPSNVALLATETEAANWAG